MTTVDMYTRTEDDELHADRNFQLIREGQPEPVVLRFHFDERWDDRITRVVSMLNGNRVYSMPMHGDEVRVPGHMLAEGCLKLIVRGFKLTEVLNVVVRNEHIMVTDAPLAIDEPVYLHTDRLGGFSVSDEETSERRAFAYEKPSDHWVASDETVYKETHDVPPIAEDPSGYVEASLMGDEAIRIGRKLI